MRGENEVSTPNVGGVCLWPGKFDYYEVDVVPENGEPYTREVYTTSYARPSCGSERSGSP